MDRTEFHPKLTSKMRFSYIFLFLLMLGFLAAAFWIHEREPFIFFMAASILLAVLLFFSVKNVMIKSIVFEDKITVRKYFSKDIVIQYDEIIDVGPMFIKTKKLSIPLNNFKNSSEMADIVIQKVKEGVIKPTENHHVKLAREAAWAGAASGIAYILYVIIAIFAPIPIRSKEIKFLVIFFPLFIIIYLILKAIDIRKQTPATKIIDNGFMLLELGDLDGAMKAFDKALDMEPNNSYAYGGKAEILHHLGRIDEAIRLYDKAIELEPKFSNAYMNKGNCLSDLGRFEEAIACYDKAYALDKDMKYYYYNKSIVLEKQGRLGEALESINKFIKAEKELGFGYYRKSIILSRLDRREEAIAILKKALKLTPNLSEEARTDEGFENIRYENEFRGMVESRK